MRVAGGLPNAGTTFKGCWHMVTYMMHLLVYLRFGLCIIISPTCDTRSRVRVQTAANPQSTATRMQACESRSMSCRDGRAMRRKLGSGSEPFRAEHMVRWLMASLLMLLLCCCRCRSSGSSSSSSRSSGVAVVTLVLAIDHYFSELHCPQLRVTDCVQTPRRMPQLRNPKTRQRPSQHHYCSVWHSSKDEGGWTAAANAFMEVHEKVVAQVTATWYRRRSSASSPPYATAADSLQPSSLRPYIGKPRATLTTTAPGLRLKSRSCMSGPLSVNWVSFLPTPCLHSFHFGDVSPVLGLGM